MAFLEYPVTRPISLGRWSTTLISVVATLFVTIITLVNVIAVGYELVPFSSTSFNDTNHLWYAKFVPAEWGPESRNCESITIKIGERMELDSN